MTKPILVVALAAIFFINFYQASDSQNYGSFFMTRDDFANSDPSSDDTNNIIDESFHKCSNKKSCGKVAENFKTNKCKIVAVGQELPCEKQNTRIWHKGMPWRGWATHLGDLVCVCLPAYWSCFVNLLGLWVCYKNICCKYGQMLPFYCYYWL